MIRGKSFFLPFLFDLVQSSKAIAKAEMGAEMMGKAKAFEE
jgi:hypothetical protein